MGSKRIKISFETVNNGNFTVIKRSDIAETNKRIKKAMKVVVREYKKNEFLSQQHASKLILNE